MYRIGVDLGGTTVKMGVFTEHGQIIAKWEIKTRTENDGEGMYKRFVARNTALAQLNEKGIMPITFADVDREMKYSIQNPKT